MEEEILKAYVDFKGYAHIDKQVLLKTFSFETFKAGYDAGHELALSTMIELNNKNCEIAQKEINDLRRHIEYIAEKLKKYEQ